MDVRRFRKDIEELEERICSGEDAQVETKVRAVGRVLVKLYGEAKVKINHSALELVCAKALVKEGYDVKVEHPLGNSLVGDLVGTRNDGKLLVEIETGFIPPEAALDPSSYARSRIASKIARYSRVSGSFALGTTPTYLLDFPEFFVQQTNARSLHEARRIKAMTDVYYDNPAITIEEFMGARLDAVFVIDVDGGATRRMDPRLYYESVQKFGDGTSPNPYMKTGAHSRAGLTSVEETRRRGPGGAGLDQ